VQFRQFLVGSDVQFCQFMVGSGSGSWDPLLSYRSHTFLRISLCHIFYPYYHKHSSAHRHLILLTSTVLRLRLV
jgi:hypothetical protein